MDEDRIITAAEADLALAVEALETHQKDCKTIGIDAACLSLAWYVDRAERQIALLAVNGEPQAMF